MRIKKLSLYDAAMPDKRGHPINLAHTENKAVTPIKPAAQKFHRLIFCNLLDNSVTLLISSMPDLLLRKCHIADVNQHAADPHPVIIAAVSMSDLIVHSGWSNYSSETLSPVHVAALWASIKRLKVWKSVDLCFSGVASSELTHYGFAASQYRRLRKRTTAEKG